MSQKSMLWETQVGEGDGSHPYTQADAGWYFSNFYTLDKTTMGVIHDVDNELEVTGTSSPLAVDTGKAVVYQFRYWNDASKNIAITTPTNGDTGGRIVLEADWSANTVRAVAISNDDGVSSTPLLTQTENDIWQIPLASFVIDTAGNIWTDQSKDTAGVTDERFFNLSPMAGAFLVGQSTGDGTFDSVTITIPRGLYNQLVIVGAGKSGNADLFQNIGIRMNGDTGANYRDFITVYGYTGSAGDLFEDYTSRVGQTTGIIGRLPGTLSSAESPGFFEVYIPNIRGTKNNKAYFGTGYYRHGENFANQKKLVINGMWQNTSAITSITINDMSATDFPAGFTLSVYGWR